ncbi:hypothetical protein CsatB_014247 [Cannabis sativa]
MATHNLTIVIGGEGTLNWFLMSSVKMMVTLVKKMKWAVFIVMKKMKVEDHISCHTIQR